MIKCVVYNERLNEFFNEDTTLILVERFFVEDIIEAMKAQNWNVSNDGSFETRKFFVISDKETIDKALLFELDANGDLVQ